MAAETVAGTLTVPRVRGMRAFLGEPRLQGLPAVLEGPGIDGKAVVRKDIQIARRLHRDRISKAS